MRDCRRRRGALRVAFLSTSLTLAATSPVLAGESNVRLRGAPGMAVRRAIEGALLRLEEPACRQVFLEFSDTAGRPLQAALDQLRETPESYLRGFVFFYDGSSQRRCASGEILGGTQPGSRVVYVCPLQFFEADQRNTLLTEAFIIHETLHSLGLGENPPASSEITSRVMKRCPERRAVNQRQPVPAVDP
jgi:hypothetical protein